VVADISLISNCGASFVFSGVVTGRLLGKVVGWELSRTMTSRLAIAALERAIVERQPPLGLVHHSDRGVQYACKQYVALLEQHQMIASMKPAGKPL